MQHYLVVDDIAPELVAHPIYVPMPPEVFAGGAGAVRNFTVNVVRDLMRLPYYDWPCRFEHVAVGERFDVRNCYVYPKLLLCPPGGGQSKA